jgi:glycine betaine transporter
MAIPRSRLVLLLALPLTGAFALWGLARPDAMVATSVAVTGTVLGSLGWLVKLLASAALLLVAWLGLGRHRHARLGQPHERPAFSAWSWIAMLFAAGMGTGLVVWGVAEPITHYLAPPGGPLAPADAARQAMVLTYLHWGLHAWAIYALCGLVIAWFSFRHGRPALVSSPLEGLLPGRAGSALAVAADSLGILSVTFGLAATLAMGILTVRSGLVASGVQNLPTWAPLAGLLTLGAIAMASALSGVGRGIRILSDINILIAIALMAAVLLLGPTADLLALFARSVLAYVVALPGLAFAPGPIGGNAQWTQDWTLTYFLWWLAWGPFVGVFIARISRGRTVGQFVCGVVLVPTLGSMLWFAVMGGSGLLTIGAEGVDGPLATAVRTDPPAAMTLFLNSLPAGDILGWVAMALLLVFVITSVDSAIFVLGMLSAGGAETPPLLLRFGWGIALLLLSAAMLTVATVEAARAMAILGALPYPLILVLQTGALLKSLRQHRSRVGPVGASP